MNNALEVLKREFKPYRLTKKKNVTIIDSTSGTFVVKEKKDNKVTNAYEYLKSRNFDYFPPLALNDRGDVNVFEYIEDVKMPKEQKAMDMVDLVALLHNKTTYFKEVTEDKYKEIYENLKDNIIYTKNYYEFLYDKLIEEVYPSPSHYLLMRNIYKIFESLDFCTNELEDWFEKSRNEKKTRVAFIHNNLETDHFIKNNREYLISWEKAKIDSPVLDLIVFYQKEYMNLNFEAILERYFRSYPLSPEEKHLFFLVISIPPIINLEGRELSVTKEIRQKLDYMFKTEDLVKNLLPPNNGDK